MKLLYIVPRVRGIGGVAQYVSKLRDEMEARGYEVHVMSIENTFHVPIKNLYNPSFAIFSMLKSLLKSISGERYDVAHGHNLLTWPALRSTRCTGTILTQHGIFSQQVGMLHGRILWRISREIENFVVKSVNVLTCISRSTCAYYRKLGVKTIYIPNAIDLKELPKEGLRIYNRQVIYVGRLSYEKGFDVLLKAAQMIDPDVHLIVAGSGMRKFEEFARMLSRKLNNFHFLGYVPRRKVLEMIKGSDLLVLPSRSEGLPTVLLEAMALKTPILASRIPGVLDVVDDSCAILVEPEDARKLASAINSSLVSYPRFLVERAYERILKEFNWKNVAKKYAILYEKLVSD